MPVFLDENNLGSCIEIAVIDDLIIEGTEMFSVVLQATSSNAFVVDGRGTATVSIVDNDQGIPLHIHNFVCYRGNGRYWVCSCVTLFSNCYAIRSEAALFLWPVVAPSLC